MKKKRIAVIGGGISGMSFAHFAKENYEIEIFERDSRPGGLIKCENVDGNLYHVVGGHVFNSRRKEILDWFWGFFNKEKEFTKSTRNAVAYMGKPISYPIENNLFQMDRKIVESVITELLELRSRKNLAIDNFEDFLRNRFGGTLYKEYFQPYNEKIWRKNLKEVPLAWLEGKLPMPTIEEVLLNNIFKEKEINMVHSTFFYPVQGGSQFIADRLAEGLKIHFNRPVEEIVRSKDKWIVNGDETFDKIVYAGNIKFLPHIFNGKQLLKYRNEIEALEYHGTTTVLCEIDKNDYSWIYLPDRSFDAHRIICSGNFSRANNKNGGLSATIEFTDHIEEADIHKQLKLIPFNPRYIKHSYTKYTYPIQDVNTRLMISSLKKEIESLDLFLLGRFAEWEYYNMDTAMGAAMDLAKAL